MTTSQNDSSGMLHASVHRDGKNEKKLWDLSHPLTGGIRVISAVSGFNVVVYRYKYWIKQMFGAGSIN